MKGFLISLYSEYYKTRKTLAFWAAILLPLIICSLLTFGAYSNSDRLAPYPPAMLWMRYSSNIVGVMGVLLLPMFIVFLAYSINAIEHKADSWKTLFTLPEPKLSVYAAKFIYSVILLLLTLSLFFSFTILSGNLLGMLKPELRFQEFSFTAVLSKIYLKLFLSGLGIFSIQFFLSIIWSDFLKPMGIGFLGTICGVITGQVGWKYAYIIPYAHPALALNKMQKIKKGASVNEIDVDLFTREIWISIAVSVVIFVAGFYVVKRKSVK